MFLACIHINPTTAHQLGGQRVQLAMHTAIVDTSGAMGMQAVRADRSGARSTACLEATKLQRKVCCMAQRQAP